MSALVVNADTMLSVDDLNVEKTVVLKAQRIALSAAYVLYQIRSRFRYLPEIEISIPFAAIK